MNEDVLISMHFGGEIKSLGDNRIGGYLIRFNKPDLDGDFFTKNTDFGFDEQLDTPIYLHHRQPLKTRKGGTIIIKDRIGKGTLTKDEEGILIDAILYNSEQFRKGLAAMGWSSGTAPHVVERRQVGKSSEVTIWPLGLDASVTPKPCDPGNICSLKAYLEETAEVFADDLLELNEPEPETKSEPEPELGMPVYTSPTLDSLLSPVSRGSLEQHSDVVVTATEELSAFADGVGQGVKAFSSRLRDKLEFRYVKDGRSLSTATIEKAQTVLDRVDQCLKDLGAVREGLKTNLDLAGKTRTQYEMDDEAARYELWQVQQLLSRLPKE